MKEKISPDLMSQWLTKMESYIESYIDFQETANEFNREMTLSLDGDWNYFIIKWNNNNSFEGRFVSRTLGMDSTITPSKHCIGIIFTIINVLVRQCGFTEFKFLPEDFGFKEIQIHKIY